MYGLILPPYHRRMSSVGVSEIFIIILLIVVFIFGVGRIASLGKRIENLHRSTRGRPVLVAGRIDADDQFRTQDWDQVPVASDDDERRRRLRNLLAILTIVVLVGISLVLALAGRHYGKTFLLD